MNRPAPPPTRVAREAGFTLIELAVVLGVVGLLVALLLPAVLAARGAARRTECQNNLRQIGLAVEQFAGARGVYPSAWETQPAGWPPFEKGWATVHALLLPGLEREPLFRRYLELGPTDGRQTAPWMFARPVFAPVPTFRCPADPGPAGVPDGAGGTNYRFNHGATVHEFGLYEPRLAGPFGIYTGGPRDVRDGLSNTACASEKLLGRSPDGWDPRTDAWATGLWGAHYPRMLPSAEVTEFCLSNSPDRVPAGGFYGYAGGTWVAPGFQFTWYNHAAPPNHPAADCDLGSSGRGWPRGGIYRASSDHAGGAHALLLDGSVRFAPDGTDAVLWRAAGSKAGGEPDAAF